MFLTKNRLNLVTLKKVAPKFDSSLINGIKVDLGTYTFHRFRTTYGTAGQSDPPSYMSVTPLHMSVIRSENPILGFDVFRM